MPYAWTETPAPPQRPLHRTLAAAGLTIVALAVLGGPLGLIWHFLSPTVPVINAGDGRIVINEQSPEQFVAADGWFTLLGFVFGLIVAVVAWLVLRRFRGPWLLISVTVGTFAASVTAWQIGRLIGLGAYQDWQRTSTLRDTYQAPPDLHAYAVLLVPAFAAVIVLTLAAGWSNDPNLDEPGALPGYGRDYPEAPALSSDWPGAPDPTAAPAPPGPGPAAPPRG
jgi:Protein of unknown function (DUF2567)